MIFKKIGMTALSCVAAATANYALAANVQPGSATAEQQGVKIENYPFRIMDQRSAGTTGQVPKRIAPMKISPSGGTIYGYLGYYSDPDNNQDDCAYYELKTTGEYEYQWAPPEAPLSTGFIRGNELCTYIQQTMMGYIVRAFYATFNTVTGEQTSSTQLSTYMKPLMVVSSAYDPEEDAAYGFSYALTGSGHAFVKIDMTKPTVMPRIIRNMKEAGAEGSDDYEVCYAMTYSPKDKQIYGINKRGEMVVIDRATGTQEVIYKPDTGQEIQNLVTGLTYSPFDQAFIWNTYLADGESYLFKLDPEAKTCEQIAKFSRKEEFNFLLSPDELVDFEGPAAPAINSNTFAGTPSTDGSFSITMPAKMYDGSAIATGTGMTLSCRLDGKEVKELEAKSGETVSATFSEVATGLHNFSFVAKMGDHFSTPASATIYIGKDNPAVPKDVVFTPSGISWSAVTTGAKEGYIDPSTVKYEVYVDDVLIGETTGTSLAHEMPKATVAAHWAKVYAVCGEGLKSDAGVSDKLLFGDPLELDVTFGPTSQNEVDLFTIIDCNNDGRTWYAMFDDYETVVGDFACFTYKWHKENPGDDWLILPPINFSSADQLYNISFDAAATLPLTRPNERFEVYFGTEPTAEAMQNMIMDKTVPPTDPSTKDFIRFEKNFVVPEAGTYYVGIHCISDPEQYRLRLKDIRIEQTESSDMPKQVEALAATAASDGSLSANVTFSMPTQTTSGETYGTDTLLSAIVKSSVEVKTVTDFAPGAPVETAIATAQGQNDITVQVVCGDFVSKVSRISVFTGIDIPAAVQDFSAAENEDNSTIHVTWAAPAAGVNGGLVSADGKGLKYYLVTVDNTEFKYTYIGTDVYQYDCRVDDYDNGLREFYFSIVAENEVGRLDDANIPLALCVLGKPYALPIADDFSGYDFAYKPVTTWAVDERYLGASWQVTDPSVISSEYSSPTGRSIIGQGSQPGARGRFSLPKFSTSGTVKPAISFDVWVDMNTALTDIYAESCGTGLVKIGTVAMSLTGDGWTEKQIVLPEEFKGKEWVAICFDAQFPMTNKYLLIDRYEIKDIESGVETAYSGSSVKAGDKSIVLTGHDGHSVTVATADGLVIFSGTVDGDVKVIEAASGLYIVRCGSETAKLLVR